MQCAGRSAAHCVSALVTADMMLLIEGCTRPVCVCLMVRFQPSLAGLWLRRAWAVALAWVCAKLCVLACQGRVCVVMMVAVPHSWLVDVVVVV